MKPGLILLSACVALFFASPALAQEKALVQCAWTRAGTTSATLVSRVRFDKQYVYDADGSPTIGLLMRIWAACRDEKAVLAKATRGKVNIRDFFKKLKAARPSAIQPDSFVERVFRCEIRFRDGLNAEPVAVAWGFGADLSQHQLSYTANLQGQGQTISSAELDNPDALIKLLKQAEQLNADALEVETIAEGRASGRAYKVKDGGGARSCKVVHADGSYSDA